MPCRHDRPLACRSNPSVVFVVTIDFHSALRLAAEGAVWFDIDYWQATREGHPVALPGPDDTGRPILVAGDCQATVRAAAQELQDRGLPAWQVLPHPEARNNNCLLPGLAGEA
jgi:nucleotide-binding universal stress UspA family protein